jgi:ATP-binding cassette subfamily C protein LapB
VNESAHQEKAHAQGPNPLQQLAWSFQRLAQQQGARIDAQRLASAALELDPKHHLQSEGLNRFCKSMDVTAPKWLRKPDRLLLPLIACTSQHGWGLVVDRNAHGNWVLSTPTGAHQIGDDELSKRCALVQIGPKSVLGFGLLGAKPGDALSFMGHVKQVLKLYRREIIESTLASAFIGMRALATSLFSMQVYDRVIPTRSEYTLAILAMGVVLSILIELAMKFARANVMDYVVVGMDNRLSREVFDRLLQLRVDQLPASVGSLAAQIRGYEQIRSFYTASTLFTLIDLPLGLLFILVIAVMASTWVAMVPLVFAGVALILGFSIRRQIMLSAKEGAAMSNLKTGLLVEAVEGIETIKAGSGGWKFLSRWIGVNAQTIRNDLKMRHSQESVAYYSATLQQLSYAGLVVVGSYLVMTGHMTMGAMIASSILSGRILQPIMAIPGLLVQHAHAQAALDGLERLYQLKTDHDKDNVPIAPERLLGMYQLKDVKFGYGENPHAIVIPQLEIHPGERIAVLGPIGAGKSSLLRILSGLYQPREGRVLIDHLELSQISRHAINQQIGYLQQEHRLFQGSLRENLLIGLPDPGDEVILQAMRRTGMDHMLAGHPRGLELPIMEGGRGLSGGQKQLVAFTRLVLCNPSVYLLDEPTASMDEDQERRCLQVLQHEAAAGKTMVLVTHKAAILPLVDRIIVVVGSQIVMDGPRDAVLNELQQRNQAALRAQAKDSLPTPQAKATDPEVSAS